QGILLSVMEGNSQARIGSEPDTWISEGFADQRLLVGASYRTSQPVCSCKNIFTGDRRITHAAGTSARRRGDHAQQPYRHNVDRPRWRWSSPLGWRAPVAFQL